jgi:hypothetical protein
MVESRPVGFIEMPIVEMPVSASPLVAVPVLAPVAVEILLKIRCFPIRQIIIRR